MRLRVLRFLSLLDSSGVTQGGVDSDAEQIADPAGVCAGSADLLQDAVFAQHHQHDRGLTEPTALDT